MPFEASIAAEIIRPCNASGKIEKRLVRSQGAKEFQLVADDPALGNSGSPGVLIKPEDQIIGQADGKGLVHVRIQENGFLATKRKTVPDKMLSDEYKFGRIQV